MTSGVLWGFLKQIERAWKRHRLAVLCYAKQCYSMPRRREEEEKEIEGLCCSWAATFGCKYHRYGTTELEEAHRMKNN